jgi:hypothetical protein
MWANWIILAEESEDNLFCFCPIEGYLWSGNYTIIHDFKIMSETPPDGSNIVAAYHSGGDEAIGEWYKNNYDNLVTMFNYEL